MKVLAVPDVLYFLDDLVLTLYRKDYFGSIEKARKYVDYLSDDIFDNLPYVRHRPAPSHYEGHGEDLFYAAFSVNKKTTWYAFFTKYEENNEIIYLICYIGNNHTEAHHLYEGNY